MRNCIRSQSKTAAQPFIVLRQDCLALVTLRQPSHRLKRWRYPLLRKRLLLALLRQLLLTDSVCIESVASPRLQVIHKSQITMNTNDNLIAIKELHSTLSETTDALADMLSFEQPYEEDMIAARREAERILRKYEEIANGQSE